MEAPDFIAPANGYVVVRERDYDNDGFACLSTEYATGEVVAVGGGVPWLGAGCPVIFPRAAMEVAYGSDGIVRLIHQRDIPATISFPPRPNAASGGR